MLFLQHFSMQSHKYHQVIKVYEGKRIVLALFVHCIVSNCKSLQLYGFVWGDVRRVDAIWNITLCFISKCQPSYMNLHLVARFHLKDEQQIYLPK